MSTRLLIYMLAAALFALIGWNASSYFRKPCPVCPPGNTISIGKLKRNTGDLVFTQVAEPIHDTIYICDSVTNRLSPRQGRKLNRWVNKSKK